MTPNDDPTKTPQDPVRYAVVGLGWFAQAAVLPAFAHAEENSKLVALVSGSEEKLSELGDRYDIDPKLRVGYDGYRELLESGAVDAVYIVSPNHLHRDHAVTAARAGVHVLTEKPMATTVAECEEMIQAARDHDVRLMVAYRLHFEPTNLETAEIVRTGELGEPRLLSMVFASPVTHRDDIRLNPWDRGGGSVWDVGVYCINAGRYYFGAEPTEVVALAASSDDPRFSDTDEMTGAVLRYPGDRIATFVSSLGAHDHASATLLGTEGKIHVEPAFDFGAALAYQRTTDDGTEEVKHPERDQVAPEIVHFSDCVQSGEEPEPSGAEGLEDVRIIRAIYQSSRDGGRPVKLPERQSPGKRPTADQKADYPPVGHQELVDETPPAG